MKQMKEMKRDREKKIDDGDDDGERNRTTSQTLSKKQQILL